MTLAEAIASVLGSIGFVLGSPIAVAFYACFMFFFAIGLAIASIQGDLHWTGHVAVWALVVLSALFGLSLAVWVTSSGGPFTWGAA